MIAHGACGIVYSRETCERWSKMMSKLPYPDTTTRSRSRLAPAPPNAVPSRTALKSEVKYGLSGPASHVSCPYPEKSASPHAARHHHGIGVSGVSGPLSIRRARRGRDVCVRVLRGHADASVWYDACACSMCAGGQGERPLCNMCTLSRALVLSRRTVPGLALGGVDLHRHPVREQDLL